MAPTHGLASTYRHRRYKCRCDECCAANTKLQRRENLARRAKTEAGVIPGSVQHGTWSTYVNWSCRCDECKAEGSRINRVARERRIVGPTNNR